MERLLNEKPSRKIIKLPHFLKYDFQNKTDNSIKLI